MQTGTTTTTLLRLIMRRGPTPGAIYELSGDEIGIGRGSRNQIVIHDNEVSREHCKLVRLMDDYELRDLSSVNGTFVNGQRVLGGLVLQPGMLIELGDSITLEYERLRLNMLDSSATSTELPTEPALQTRFRYRMMVTGGATVGRIYNLRDVIVTAGRDLSNDIIVQDPEVSRYHLRLRRVKVGYSVEDMGSTNGTYVNEVPLEGPVMLNSNDVIRLGGSVTLQYMQEMIAEDEVEDSEVLELHAEDAHSATSSMRSTMQIPIVEPARDETLYSGILRGVRSQIKTSELGTGLEPGNLNNHVLIAYAREEWESTIAALTLTLQDAGVDTWVDQYLVRGSDDWRAAMEQALVECPVMVLFATQASLADPYVRMAYRHFSKMSDSIIVLNDHLEELPQELLKCRTVMYDSHNQRKSFNKLLFEIMQARS